MKKVLMVLFAVVIMLTLALLSNAGLGVKAVSAFAVPTVTPGGVVSEGNLPAEGSWEYDGEGENVHPDHIMLPAPNPWQTLLATGLQVESGPMEICHPFRGGQFGWTGAIYLKNGNSWLEIPSTTEWTPDEEGRILICATAPMSGTYAIFGYAEPYAPAVMETEVPLANDRPTSIDLPSSAFIIK